MDEEEFNHVQNLRIDLVRRLYHLEEQRNKLDALTPPGVLIQIEDTKREIAEIDQRLLAHSILTQPAPSAEIKQAIRDTHGTYMDFLIAQMMSFGQRQTAMEDEIRESRVVLSADRDDRTRRQRNLDIRFDRIEGTLARQDETLADQTGDIKVVRQRQRHVRNALIWIIVIVGVLVAFRVYDVWYFLFR